MIADVEALYAAGADYVMVSRLIEAGDLREVLKAAGAGDLAARRALFDAHMQDRKEVLA